MIDVDSLLLKKMVKAYIVGTFEEELYIDFLQCLILPLSFSCMHQLVL
jgi:hypothetical protein